MGNVVLSLEENFVDIKCEGLQKYNERYTVKYMVYILDQCLIRARNRLYY